MAETPGHGVGWNSQGTETAAVAAAAVARAAVGRGGSDGKIKSMIA